MTYRAKTDIHAAPGVIAYLVGDVVPDSAVKNLGVEAQVEKATDDEAPSRPARSRRPRKTAAPTTAPVPSVDPEAGSAPE